MSVTIFLVAHLLQLSLLTRWILRCTLLPEQDLSQVILARKNSPTLPVIALDRNNKIELAQGHYLVLIIKLMPPQGLSN